MIRNNRQITRAFFILVICASLYGYSYALRNWQISGESFDVVSISEDSDWIDLAATLGEEALQLFLGLTSPSEEP